MKNNLRLLRQQKNLPQSKLAKEVGVTRQMMWGYETGKYDISPEMLKKLAAVLSVDPNYILTGKPGIGSEGPIDSKRMVEAIKLTHDFYKDYNFDQETMSKIAVEVYNFMHDFSNLAKEIGSKDFDRSLNNKIISGLAAKCFFDFNKK